MEEKDFIKKAGQILANVLPGSSSKFGAHVQKDYFLQITGPMERKQLLKVLRIAGFKDSTRHENGKTTRGYYITNNENGCYDTTKLSYNKPKKMAPIPIVLNTEDAVLTYISNNWGDLYKYMTTDIKDEYKRDPSFKNMTTFKKNKTIRQAGFKHTFTLFEDSRVEAAPELPKNKSTKTKQDATRLLYPELFS
jgi:hypothetical protein